MKTTSKAIRSSKKLPPAVEKKDEVPSPVWHADRPGIKTVLVASYGWPTADMQPAKRQAVRR